MTIYNTVFENNSKSLIWQDCERRELRLFAKWWIFEKVRNLTLDGVQFIVIVFYVLFDKLQSPKK